MPAPPRLTSPGRSTRSAGAADERRSPSSRTGARSGRPLVPRQQAVNAIRDADVRFEYALYGMDSFPERIRKVSEAALEESRAMELAVLANIQWPGRDSELSALGSDVAPGTDRPGPKRLWTDVDRALAGVKNALADTSMKRTRRRLRHPGRDHRRPRRRARNDRRRHATRRLTLARRASRKLRRLLAPPRRRLPRSSATAVRARARPPGVTYRTSHTPTITATEPAASVAESDPRAQSGSLASASVEVGGSSSISGGFRGPRGEVDAAGRDHHDVDMSAHGDWTDPPLLASQPSRSGSGRRSCPATSRCRHQDEELGEVEILDLVLHEEITPDGDWPSTR